MQKLCHVVKDDCEVSGINHFVNEIRQTCETSVDKIRLTHKTCTLPFDLIMIKAGLTVKVNYEWFLNKFFSFMGNNLSF